MKIDVVLATYNRDHLLGRAIESFALNPQHGAARLLVVDNNSSDNTRAVVEAARSTHSGVAIEYLFEPRQGKAHALNLGVSHSEADVVGFFDDDETLAPDWLAVLALAFQDPALEFVGGPVRPDWSAPAPGWMPKSGYNGVLSLVDHGPGRRRYDDPAFKGMLIGANAAIRRSTLLRVGPYTTRFKWAEDREMHVRLLAAGAVGYYLPELVVSHHIPPKRLEKRYFRQWAYSEGRTMGSPLQDLEQPDAQVRTALGAPLWMWRRLLHSTGRAAWGYLRGRDNASTFAAELDVRQFIGFYLERNASFVRQGHFDRT